MSLKYSFSGKKILITGGGQGIGRQLVQRFHDDGAIVYTVDRNPETVAALKKALPKVTVELLDISDWDKTKKVIESFGVIDHLVNNAQLLNAESFLDITKDAIIRQFNTAIPGLINVSQVFSKALIAAGKPGTIVNVSSIASQKPFPPAIVYGALQAAIENLTKSMAVELSGTHNIRVNGISIGIADAPMIRSSGASIEQLIEGLKDKLVIQKIIDPNQIADLIMFLLSPLGAMICGENVVIDCGLLQK